MALTDEQYQSVLAELRRMTVSDDLSQRLLERIRNISKEDLDRYVQERSRLQ